MQECKNGGVDTTVAALDTAASQVLLESGERLDYASLVLTLGAELIRPPMGGDAANDVMGVNDLDDYRRFRETLDANGSDKVAVIGAGLIGCEFSNDLLNGGFSVEAVDPVFQAKMLDMLKQTGKFIHKV